MGGRGAKSGSLRLHKIEYDPDWLYQPDDKTDLADMVKNPIPFVGVGEDKRLGYEIEDETIQTNFYEDVLFPVDKLETLQPFVLQSGITNYQRYDETDRPYVVRYQDHFYLLDGNHRAAIAKLKGQKYIAVNLSEREKR